MFHMFSFFHMFPEEKKGQRPAMLGPVDSEVSEPSHELIKLDLGGPRGPAKVGEGRTGRAPVRVDIIYQRSQRGGV